MGFLVDVRWFLFASSTQTQHHRGREKHTCADAIAVTPPGSRVRTLPNGSSRVWCSGIQAGMAATPHPWIEIGDAPLYRHNYPADAHISEVTAFIVVWERLVMSSTTPYAVVADLSHVLKASSLARKAFSDLQQRIAAHEAVHCAGTALVVPNAFARGLITAVHWVSPPACTYKLCTTIAEARQWALAQLQQRVAGASSSRSGSGLTG
jgi:hypothetical protein